MTRAGLVEPGGAVFVMRDKDCLQGKKDGAVTVLEKVITRLNREVAIFAVPAEPYRSIIDYLAAESESAVYPRDFETGILLTDLPVVAGLDDADLAAALKTRRGAIVRGRGIVATAKSGVERAFVVLSSMAFACFVKFFVDCLYHARRGTMDGKRSRVFSDAVHSLGDPAPPSRRLAEGPFSGEEEILAAMEEAGALTVASRLVDSNFGNISYRLGSDLYISRTGSALDELSGRIDRIDLGGASVPSTVSTEFPAHRGIVDATGRRAVLHGHPKFPVILSMDCERSGCELRDSCQTRCPHPRSIGGIPVVSGEAGGGAFGLAHTVPPAMRGSSAVIVYGHGLFTAGENDYNEAFRVLRETEDHCRRECLRRIAGRAY